MRRKTQLLRENSNKFKDSNREIRQLNYNIRAQIFEHRFGPQDTRFVHKIEIISVIFLNIKLILGASQT